MEESTYNDSTTNFSDHLSSQITYTLASTNQRFANYMIDNLLMQFGLSYLTGTAVGILLGLLFPGYIMRISQSKDMFDLLPVSYLIGVVNYLVYYTICEKGFKGYTLGKLVTGTRVIREDGDELTIKDALLRSLSRLVPFEIFSAFGAYPWHDSWTKTRVIRTR